MGKKAAAEPVEMDDPTAWILDNGFAEFVLMHTNEIVSGRIFLFCLQYQNQ